MKTGYLAIYIQDGNYIAPQTVKSTPECAADGNTFEAVPVGAVFHKVVPVEL
jgi:hypothetical protein